MAIFAELLPLDAVANNAALLYIQNAGDEPAQLAETEKVLKSAIEKNPAQAQQLRFLLAKEVYQTRMKDLDKARAVFKEIVAEPTLTDGSLQNPLSFLLGTPASEEEFKATVASYLKIRKKHYHSKEFRNFLKQWIATASAKKETEAHAEYAKAQLEAADSKDAVLQDWLASESTNPQEASPRGPNCSRRNHLAG